jgi:DNA-binding transcriptional LysR family regulator
MDERDLLIIKYLSIFKNITSTANALFISQPALTRRIKQIERDLHTKLIISSNKGIQLTPTGLEAVAFAEESLTSINKFKERIESLEHKRSGLIKIGAPNIICEYYSPSIVAAFKNIHPDASFNILAAASSEVVSLLNSNKIDFGFTRNDFGWNKDEMILLATNHIVAASVQPFELKDLVRMNRVAYSTDSYYLKMLDLWWDSHFNTPPKVDVQVNSLNLCLQMVLQGIGFGLLPDILIPESAHMHEIVLNDIANRPIQRHTYLIFKKDRIRSKLFRDFLKFIKDSNFSEFLHLN